jgi:uncharacterized protein YjbI with pentapeptide repeats
VGAGGAAGAGIGDRRRDALDAFPGVSGSKILGPRSRAHGGGATGGSAAGADLQGAVLAGADLQSANLEGTDLQGACLEEANLHNTRLAGANLTQASLRGAVTSILRTKARYSPLT